MDTEKLKLKCQDQWTPIPFACVQLPFCDYFLEILFFSKKKLWKLFCSSKCTRKATKEYKEFIEERVIAP